MFEKFTNWAKGAINKMMNKKTIQEKLKAEIVLSTEMEQSIGLWTKIYSNNAPWLNPDVKSLRLAAAISAEFARQVLLEYKSEITGSPRADFLNECYKEYKKNLKKNLEYGLAKGGLLIKPYIENNKIIFDYTQADAFYVTSYDSSNNITGVITMDVVERGKKTYYRLEQREFKNNSETISNFAFVSENKGQPYQTNLKAVPEWADIEPVILIENIKKPLFSYFKTPLANEIDPKSPLGVSIFSRATELIEQADKQYWRFIWENESGERFLGVDISAFLKGDDGQSILPHKRLYKSFDTGAQDLFEEWSPTLRNTEILSGFDNILKRIEFNVGLAYGTLSDPQTVDKTATEIKQSKQRSFATITDIQSALKEATDNVIYAADILATLYNLSPKGLYTVSHEFDDSIVADRETQFSELKQLTDSGYLKPEYLIGWYFGKDPKATADMIPKTEEITLE